MANSKLAYKYKVWLRPPEQAEFVRQIVEVCERLNWTIAELAEALELNPNKLRRIVKGQTNATWPIFILWRHWLRYLADVYGVRFDFTPSTKPLPKPRKAWQPVQRRRSLELLRQAYLAQLERAERYRDIASVREASGQKTTTSKLRVRLK